MAYSAKLAGTRYIIEMEFSPDQVWYVNLTVDGTVDNRVPLKSVSISGLENAVEELISNMLMEINPLQQQKLVNDLKRSTKHIFDEAKYQNVNPAVDKTNDDNGSTSPHPVYQSAQPASKVGFTQRTTSQNNNDEHISSNEQPLPAGQIAQKRFNIEEKVIEQYRDKITSEDKVEIKNISIQELQQHENESEQIAELVKSHKEVQQTLKELDARIASLEKLTMKLTEITEMFLRR